MIMIITMKAGEALYLNNALDEQFSPDVVLTCDDHDYHDNHDNHEYHGRPFI